MEAHTIIFQEENSKEAFRKQLEYFIKKSKVGKYVEDYKKERADYIFSLLNPEE